MDKKKAVLVFLRKLGMTFKLLGELTVRAFKGVFRSLKEWITNIIAKKRAQRDSAKAEKDKSLTSEQTNSSDDSAQKEIYQSSVQTSPADVKENNISSAESEQKSTGRFNAKESIGKVGKKLLSVPKGVKIALGAVAALLVCFLVVSIYFSTHFMAGTTINGVDVSGMSAKKAKQTISDACSSYVLTLIEKNAVTEEISAKDINLKVQTADNFEHVLRLRSGLSWIGALAGKHTFNVDDALEYSYDKALLQQAISDLECSKAENASKPVNAEIYYHNGEFKIRPEISGGNADIPRLTERIEQAITNQEKSLDLESEKLYIMPEVTSSDPELTAKKGAYDHIANLTVTLKFGDKEEKLDPQTISEWLETEKLTTGEYQIKVSSDAVKNYVSSLGEIYNTFNSPKKFVTHSGETVELANSYYGWKLDVQYAAEQLERIILAKQPVSLDLTDGSEASNRWWSKTAASYDPEHYYGDTYAEVSINGQYMWMYTGGKVALESDVVTGRPDQEHDTPVGIYSILYKETNATLRGEDYETEVAYWMVFTDDIGFHDAEWQWAFGDDMYMENGSHGCVNLPIDVAESLYDLVYPGMPVFVY